MTFFTEGRMQERGEVFFGGAAAGSVHAVHFVGYLCNITTRAKCHTISQSDRFWPLGARCTDVHRGPRSLRGQSGLSLGSVPQGGCRERSRGQSISWAAFSWMKGGRPFPESVGVAPTALAYSRRPTCLCSFRRTCLTALSRRCASAIESPCSLKR